MASSAGVVALTHLVNLSYLDSWGPHPAQGSDHCPMDTDRGQVWARDSQRVASGKEDDDMAIRHWGQSTRLAGCPTKNAFDDFEWSLSVVNP